MLQAQAMAIRTCDQAWKFEANLATSLSLVSLGNTFLRNSGHSYNFLSPVRVEVYQTSATLRRF